MRYPLVMIVLLLLAVALTALSIWRHRRRKVQSRYTVSGAELMQQLPAFRTAKRYNRLSAFLAAAAIAVAMIALAIGAGAPADRHVENPKLASRDIVLCLDASGSMLPYDGQILGGFEKLVDKFSGERVSLQLWSAHTVTKFPLTDDYGLVSEELARAAKIIRDGYRGRYEDYVLVSPELSDYLHGVESDGPDQAASLIGDGLATCVLGFDRRDQERSRTVILATDNEVNGKQLYELEEAIALAEEQKVNIIALYPGASGMLTTEGQQMKELVEAAGGEFYQADDPGAIPGIIANIQEQQLASADGAKRVIYTDKPERSLLVAAWAFLIFVAVAAWRRL